ncbi:MAG: hypothetical protein OEY81_01040 [Candidatus Bathyarchaeota archaeon]|nr:hypothetical protein [Candidatus Bathyarchaeota archaeon]
MSPPIKEVNTENKFSQKRYEQDATNLTSPRMADLPLLMVIIQKLGYQHEEGYDGY